MAGNIRQRSFPEVTRAKVTHVYPGRMEVDVVFPNLAALNGAIKVKVAPQRWASARSGEFYLPQVGDWVQVKFLQDTERSAFVTGPLADRVWNAEPAEILQADPLAVVTINRDGSRSICYSNGDLEHNFADNSLLRFTSSKDGSMSNTSGRAKRSPFHRSIKNPENQPEREQLPAPGKPPIDFHFLHSTGAEITITADGSIHATTARGHKIRMHDGTEKARSSQTGAVTSTPEEDAQRINSELVLETEMGHVFRLHDDPQDAEQNRYVSLRTSLGHEILLKDKKPTDQHIKIKTILGQTFEMRDTPEANQSIKMESVTGYKLEMHDTQKIAQFLSPAGNGLLIDDNTNTLTLKGMNIIHDGEIIKLGRNATKSVVLDGDGMTPSDGPGHSHNSQSSSTKVYSE